MDRVKPKWQFWFWRLYAPAVWFWFTATAALTFVKRDVLYLKANLYSMPLYLPVVLAIGNAIIFPWQYSVFGKYRRSPLPKSPPLRTIGESTWESFRSWGGRAGVEWAQ